MPLLPIDLQTMFSHLNQIGKDQAVQKDAAHLHQSLQGMEIAKDAKVKDESVNETDEIKEGIEKIKDEEKNKGNETKAEQKKREKEEADKKNEEKQFFKEPYLGHHIDITG
ncbi:MAG: hypothetical protein JXJ04_00715 [Spirochaetales bacterium]|nr:hypothetical protein [Spirochaetales bacterium]